MLALTILTLGGLGLRLFRLSNQSFWIDEVDSITAAQGPLKGIYERSVLASNSLPTYFLMLKPLLGDSDTDLEFRARLLSALAGALSVPVFIGIVYLWRRRHKTALFAGALLAVNPLHLWYSQEVRGYAVMLLFGLLAVLGFELARQKQRAVWWVLYVLSALMAIAVHKTALIFIAACGLWHVWEVRKARQHFKNLLVHAPVALAALVVLALKSYPPGEGYSRSASGLEIAYTFLTFVGGYSFGPSVTDIQSNGALAAIFEHPFETSIMVVVLLMLALIVLRHLPRFIAGREIQLLVLGVGVVSVYALISGFPYNVRYVLPALFGFLALVAALPIELEKTIVPRITVVALLVASLWADGQWYYKWDYRKGDARAVVRWLVENRQRVHTWMILPQYMHVPVEWYLHGHPEILADEMPPTSDRTTEFPPFPDVLIITRRHHLLNPNKIVASYKSAAGVMETNNAYAGFELYVRSQSEASPHAEDAKSAK